jgi:DNA invertase Pin-like site-specific DNA recombinase
MMQGIYYTRVSSDEQVKGMSLTFQRDDCLRYAVEKNIAIAERFEEEGETAKFADRPELIRLLDYCRKHKGKINVLIIWKVDRLARNTMDYFFLKRTLLGYGVVIHSVTEPSIEKSSSTIEGKVFEAFSALQGEIDNMIRAERTRSGLEAKIASGIHPWAPPLGYRSNRSKSKGLKKTEPDPIDSERFPLIVRLFDTVISARITNTAMLADLANSWGLTTQNGKRMYFQLIDRILSNKFYAGIVVNPWTKEEFAGKHRPAISSSDFLEVQRIRKGKGHAYPALRRVEHPEFPLRRTVRCAGCLSPLTGSLSRGNGGKFAYYHCPTRSCAMYGKTIRKTLLEENFLAKLDEITPKPSRLALLGGAVVEVAQTDRAAAIDNRAANARVVSELTEHIDNLIGMKERNLLSDEEFLARKKKLNEQLVLTKASVAKSPQPVGDVEDIVDSALPFVASLPQSWLALPAVLRARFQHSVFPEGISYGRDHGYGTAKLGLIYELSRDSGDSKTHLVPLVRANWNQLLDDLKLFAQASDALKRGSQSSFELNCGSNDDEYLKAA